MFKRFFLDAPRSLQASVLVFIFLQLSLGFVMFAAVGSGFGVLAAVALPAFLCAGTIGWVIEGYRRSPAIQEILDSYLLPQDPGQREIIDAWLRREKQI